MEKFSLKSKSITTKADNFENFGKFGSNVLWCNVFKISIWWFFIYFQIFLKIVSQSMIFALEPEIVCQRWIIFETFFAYVYFFNPLLNLKSKISFTILNLHDKIYRTIDDFLGVCPSFRKLLLGFLRYQSEIFCVDF